MSGRGRSIAGRKKQTPTDLYQTPPAATEALLGVERFYGTIYEPCSGRGAISRVLEARNLVVVSSDIMDDGYGFGGYDIFERTSRMTNLITNPPYRDAQAIIEHCLPLVDDKAAFLLKLTFLESAKRKPFFEKHPPSRVWVFSKRITMWPDGEDKPVNGGTIAYAWFVWDRHALDERILGWI